METDSNHFFETKQKFLSVIPHPKVIAKYAQQMGADFKPVYRVEGDAALSDVLSKTIAAILEIRLAIANAKEKNELAKSLSELGMIQCNLIGKLSTYMDESEKSAAANLKVSEPIDAYVIQRHIKEIGLQESEIKEYLCSRISDEKRWEDVLYSAVVRSLLIVADGQKS